jgi:Flp pilus assembly CpaE family ATPase
MFQRRGVISVRFRCAYPLLRPLEGPLRCRCRVDAPQRNHDAALTGDPHDGESIHYDSPSPCKHCMAWRVEHEVGGEDRAALPFDPESTSGTSAIPGAQPHRILNLPNPSALVVRRKPIQTLVINLGGYQSSKFSSKHGKISYYRLLRQRFSVKSDSVGLSGSGRTCWQAFPHGSRLDNPPGSAQARRLFSLGDGGMSRLPLPEDRPSRDWAPGRLELRSGGDTLNSGSSSSLEMKYADSIGAKLLSIALIGPNEALRWDVSSVLADCRGVTVREFPSYPTALDDVPRLLERYFDVIIVDLDSDQEFALKLVASICAENTATVMVYSEKVDRELMARCMRAGAREYLMVPFDQSTLGKALDRARIGLHSKTHSQQKSLGDLLVFFGAKGGTGVTTIACNLAIALAQEPGHSTLLIDLAVPLGDAALNLGIAAEHSTDHALRDAERLDARLLLTFLARHRSGVFVLAAPSKVPEVEVSDAAIDRLVSVARQQFDHVIVDVGSRIDLMGTDLIKKASTIYLVTQAGISELRNSNRLISQFFSEDSPKLEIVLNRFAPHLQLGVNEEVITKALGRPVRWKIPDDHDATRQMQSTENAVSPADSPISRLIMEMASSVTGHPILPVQGFPDERPERTVPGTDVKEEFSPAVQPLNHIVPTPAYTGGVASIAWPAPDSISYGTALSAVQLNATTSVPGTLVYTPGQGYMLPAGTHTLWVTFSPAHSAGSAPVQAAVSVTVSKTTPAITWPNPPDIRCGSALEATHLNATASVPGEFAYQPAEGEVLAVGTHSLTVTFTPADTANYTAAQASVPVHVAKETPALQWPEPDPITFGEALSGAQLNATASVPGEFVYSPGAGEVLAAGTHTLTITLNPWDNEHFTPAHATVTITVAKAAPFIAWPEPEPVTYGTALGAAQLGASASVSGTFAYNPSAGALLAAGEHTPSVVFTPDDSSNYGPAQVAVRLTVGKATPVISWPMPDPIPCGEALTAAQLNATASVPGTFVYAPAAGEVLAPGSHSLAVTFRPTDGLNYTAAEATVWLTVNETSPSEITWPAPSAISYGTPLGDSQLNAAASAPGTFVYTPAAGNVLAPGRYTLSVAFAPADSGRHSPAEAAVEIVVGEPANIPFEHSASDPSPFELNDVTENDAFSNAEQDAATNNSPPHQDNHRETRTYKGAIYEKGEDGQWHLQQN